MHQYVLDAFTPVIDNASACSGHAPFVCELLAQARHYVTWLGQIRHQHGR